MGTATRILIVLRLGSQKFCMSLFASSFSISDTFDRLARLNFPNSATLNGIFYPCNNGGSVKYKKPFAALSSAISSIDLITFFFTFLRN